MVGHHLAWPASSDFGIEANAVALSPDCYLNLLNKTQQEEYRIKCGTNEENGKRGIKKNSTICFLNATSCLSPYDSQKGPSSWTWPSGRAEGHYSLDYRFDPDQHHPLSSGSPLLHHSAAVQQMPVVDRWGLTTQWPPRSQDSLGRQRMVANGVFSRQLLAAVTHPSALQPGSDCCLPFAQSSAGLQRMQRSLHQLYLRTPWPPLHSWIQTYTFDRSHGTHGCTPERICKMLLSSCQNEVP